MPSNNPPTAANADEAVKIGVLTSGGDTQGMNAVVRAVVRTAIQEGARPYAIREGWKGAVDGGDLIQEMAWGDVSNILNRGGTMIGTARSDEFRERDGMRKAVYNLVTRGIDRLVSIGGDGTLTGTDELRAEWTSLLDELVAAGDIPQDLADAHPALRIAGVVGSIDNDLVGTDMTVGADSALHRIIEALDAISSTAASHQRTFIIEVMGRHCGYLALMSAVAGGCDYVFVPEHPPADGWEDDMSEQLRRGREAGRRDSLVIIAEGAKDRHGQPINAPLVKEALESRLGEEVRVTSLGHVQRGGTPSAYDRWMSTLLGYTAAHELIHADDDFVPCIVGTRRNRIVLLPLMDAVKDTRAVGELTRDGRFDEAVAARGPSYTEMVDIFATLSSPTSHDIKRSDGRKPRVGVIHAGGLAPGMNVATRAAVRMGLDRGFEMVGIEGGFPGLIDGTVRELSWGDVDGWSGLGGAELGTRRTIPTVEQYYALGRSIENHKIDALLVIGGLKGYEAAHAMLSERDRFPAFRIPIVCVPASIDNNLPGSELSIGADTALNSNAMILDGIKQSASASRRCFVAETMGRTCGYLALMSAITTGAEQVYLHETGITLTQLAEDTKRMVRAFESGRRLYLVVRNEDASYYYTTDFLARVFEEEGAGLFDVRPAVLGHMQQGGNPSVFDRLLAARLMRRAIAELDDLVTQGKDSGAYIGMANGSINSYPLAHMHEAMDMVARVPGEQWWLGLTDVVYVVSDPSHARPIRHLNVVVEPQSDS